MTQTTVAEQAGAPPAVSPDAILQLGFGFWGSKVLLSAVELGVFTALAGTRAGGDLRRAGDAAVTAGPAPPLGTGLPGRPGRPGHAGAYGRPLRQHPRHRGLPGPGQARLPGRHPGDGQRTPPGCGSSPAP